MGSHFFRATAACFALSLYFIFGAARLLANDPAAALDPSTVGSLCSAASNSAVLRCVLDHHPDLRVARAELKRLEAELGRASQRVNPSVESRVLGGDSSFSAEASIRHTIETGGKRGARMDVAEQNISVARSRLLLQKNRLVAESALRILRLRQVLDDTALLEETRGTYLRAIRRMRSRPALSSEQRVNLATYEIAADEARSRQTVLASEAIQLRTELAIATGLGGDALASVLGLELVTRWPDPAELARENDSPNANESEELRLARSRIARARARLDLEEARAFPNFSIGPALEYNRSEAPSGGIFGGTSSRGDAEIGLSFRFTVPLFHRNNGGRDAAEAELTTERRRATTVASRTVLERRSQVQQYRLAIDALRQGISEGDLRTRLLRLRSIIQGGRVSPPAVIEFYRSMFEHHHQQHEQEFRALQALLSVYSLDGQLLLKVEQDEIF